LVELSFVHFEARTLSDVCRRVVHQNIDASELARGGGDQGFDVGGPSHVAGNWLHTFADLSGDLVECFLLPAADHHLRAFACEYLRDGTSDAPAGARDDGDFVFQEAHALISFLVKARLVSRSARSRARAASPFSAGSGSRGWPCSAMFRKRANSQAGWFRYGSQNFWSR